MYPFLADSIHSGFHFARCPIPGGHYNADHTTDQLDRYQNAIDTIDTWKTESLAYYKQRRETLAEQQKGEIEKLYTSHKSRLSDYEKEMPKRITSSNKEEVDRVLTQWANRKSSMQEWGELRGNLRELDRPEPLPGYDQASQDPGVAGLTDAFPDLHIG